jgi:hypothetical protein
MIDREKYPVFTVEEATQLVSQLKPMEIESLWEVITQNEQIQKKFDQFQHISNLLDELEERILDLKDAGNEIEYDMKKFVNSLKNE